jgi:hypothetical protein
MGGELEPGLRGLSTGIPGGLMDGWGLQPMAPDRVHGTMKEGPARSSTCGSAPHACRLHALLERCHRGNSVWVWAGPELLEATRAPGWSPPLPTEAQKRFGPFDSLVPSAEGPGHPPIARARAMLPSHTGTRLRPCDPPLLSACRG